MQDSRLIKYIQELSGKEKERFKQFVYSPYFNQHLKTQELLDLILSSQNGKADRLERHNAFKYIFPGEKYNEQKLFNVMSYLKKLFNRFLAFEYLEKKKFLEQTLTLEDAFENHRFDLLANRGKQLEKQLGGHKFRDSDYYYANYRMNYLIGYNTAQYKDRSKSQYFYKMLDNLDKYYIREKLINSCHLTANMIMLNSHYEFRFLEHLLSHIDENPELYEKDSSILMYYTILLSLREEDNQDHYMKIKDIMANKLHLLSRKEGQDLYTFSFNYCIRKINKGDSFYQNELFQLYQQGLKSEVLFEKNLLSEWDYKNITTLGCNLKEFEWTEDFIFQYKERLHTNIRENAFNYNLGYLYYYKQMYNEALRALLTVQFTDVKYHLSTSFLTLRTYYALKDTEALLSLIEAFRIYVMRNKKMTTDQKRGYTNFLRFAKKLVLVKHQSATYSKKNLSEKLESLAGKVQSTDNVLYRNWLMQECRA